MLCQFQDGERFREGTSRPLCNAGFDWSRFFHAIIKNQQTTLRRSEYFCLAVSGNIPQNLYRSARAKGVVLVVVPICIVDGLAGSTADQ